MKSLLTRLFLFNLLLIFGNKTNAQNNLPPVYEIKSDTISEFFLNSTYWQILADPDNNLVFEQVRQAPLSNNFGNIQSARNFLKKPCYTYWYRYRIKNLSNSAIRICVGSIAPRADFYFVNSNGAFKHYRTGWNYKVEEKDGFKKANLIPVEIAANEEVIIYLRRFQLTKSEPANVQMKISNAYYAMKSELTEYDTKFYKGEFVIHPFFLGLFILAAIFNIFFFFVVREKVYLYLSLFLFTFSITANTTITGVLFPSSYLVSIVLNRLIFLSLFFLLQFVRYYFKTFTLIPKWDKAVRLLGVLLCAYYLFYIIWGFNLSSVDNNISVLLGGLLFITLLVTVFRASKKQMDKAAKFFIIAVVPFLISMTILLVLLLTATFFNEMNALDNYNKWGELGIYILLAWAAIVFSWALFNRYNTQRKEVAQHAIDKERERNELIKKQKIELEIQVAERTSDLKKSLDELKSTQAQLIQSEKMASLGELTAGIAHEIQNPLNFVNNFSEVNQELIEELQTELQSGNAEGAINISNDIKENEQKISLHGKRAGDIVKGMLQHSRTNTGQKELTDINALCDEYLRLSYHGLRAKDKNFNADFKTDFDENIGKINIVPQDIGRVLLNLFNNAFYAVNEKFKIQNSKFKTDFSPVVSVQTKKQTDKVEIVVSDNGNGIPQNIIDKIFQPFFTTKPTGQGTGLGLSLAYDIITKEHNGKIKVESKEGEETKFIIELPV